MDVGCDGRRGGLFGDGCRVGWILRLGWKSGKVNVRCRGTSGGLGVGDGVDVGWDGRRVGQLRRANFSAIDCSGKRCG